MLILNPTKPIYIDKKKKTIRMGNFKNIDKEIIYEDESVLKIFEDLRTPMEKEKLIQKLKHETNTDIKEINSAINYLIAENFIVEELEYLKILNDNELSRQNLFLSMENGILKNYNSKFEDKTLLILGLGGIGSNATLQLNRMGFKKFILVDFDNIEYSNLMRQLPYNKNDIGKPKVQALKNKLSNCSVITKKLKVEDKKSLEELVVPADLILCTLDKPLRIIRRLVNEVCIEQNKPILFAGFSESVGMVGPFIVPFKTACLKCIEKKLKATPLNNVKIAPAYGPLCLMISSICCNEILNYFTKFNSNNLIGKTLMFDIFTYESKIINWKKKKNCEVCQYDS